MMELQSTPNNAKNIMINKICRICMGEKVRLRDIHRTRIPKMIESFTSVRISKGDGLPDNICTNCFQMVIKLHTFKRKIERTDKILRQNIKQRDILNIALTEADINGFQGIVNEGEVSEEDIPLTERLVKRKSEAKLGNYSDILVEGPPPLVPLHFENKTNVVEQIALKLPEDAPPLIPIKPLVNISAFEHIVPETKNVEFQCSNCEKTFTNVATFRKHKLTACQSNLLQCSICKKTFKERKKLIGHLKGHMVVKDYRCKICEKVYPNPSTFRVHLRTHTGERPFRCPTCHKGFARWAGVVGHMKTHEDIKPFSCETCGQAFKIASNLQRHKRIHSGIMPFSCFACEKSFTQSENLQLHIRTYHTKERPYLCNVCGKGFVNSTRLNRHMWIHSGYKPYVCQYCAKTYSNCNDLKNHERQHLGKNSEDSKPYACNICQRRFFHSCRLVRHKKIHEKFFQCQFCDRKYLSRALLTKHLNVKHESGNEEKAVTESDITKLYLEYENEEEPKQESFELKYE